MSEDQNCECGDPECGNGKEASWEEGVNDVFDKAFDSIEELVNRGEKPIALCIFSISEKGNLVYETAGIGPSAMTAMLLSECCLQVSDRLEEQALATPGFKDMLAKMESAEKQTSKS